MRGCWAYWIALVVAQMFSGCASMAGMGVVWQGGVSRIRDRENGGYVTGQAYELVHPLFVETTNEQIAKHRGALVAPRRLRPNMPAMRSAPPSVEFWRNGHGRTRWDAGVVTNRVGGQSCEYVLGVLEKGERIVIAGVVNEYSLSVWFGYGAVDDIVADVVGGEYDGWRVRLRDISFWGDELKPDRRFIERLYDE